MANEPLSAIKRRFSLDPDNRLPVDRYQYVNVVFTQADTDTDIRHTLNPINPEKVRYYVVKVSGPAVVYQDLTPTRKPWQRTHLWLRASQPCNAQIILFLPATDLEDNFQVPQVEEEEEEDVALSLLGGVGITIDAGNSTITTGTKGGIYIPFEGRINGWTLLSTDHSVTSGSIVMDVWKEVYSAAAYPPTIGNSIVGSDPPTLSSQTNARSTTLAGWTRDLHIGDVLFFSVASVTDLVRVTLVLDVTETVN